MKVANRGQRLPIRQGKMAEISRLFIKKMADHCPPQMSRLAWLKFLFGTDARPITQFESIKSFTIEGVLKEPPGRPIQGVGYRKVPVGTRVWVRTDANRDGCVEIEACIGQGNKEHVYEMTDIQFLRIKGCLKEIPIL